MLDPLGNNFFDIINLVIRAYLKRNKVINRLFMAVVIAGITGATIAILILTKVLNQEIWEPIAAVVLAIGIIIILVIRSYQSVQEQNDARQEIEKVEEVARNNPDKPKATWDIARIRLESYLTRNLSQVKWIFFWTVTVMIAGFVIIGYGILKVYESPTNFEPSVLVTIVGVVTELIGATFLIIYKSTMNQAKEYVNVLERINAVGMSVQILDSIDDSAKELQNTTRAELVKELLMLYGQKK